MSRRHLLTGIGAAVTTATAVALAWRWCIRLLDLLDRAQAEGPNPS